MTFDLFVWGNPLLDIQYKDDGSILKKYDLKANDAILVEEKQAGIYDDIVKTGNVAYVAGGAAQNTARGAAFVLPKSSVVYVGSVGDDDFKKQLVDANAKEGLHAEYQINSGLETGACAVILTDSHRSLVTKLGAAEAFKKEHLETPNVKKYIHEAKTFYFEGYFLTHGLESTLIIAKQIAEHKDKTLTMNLSAPFIAEFFGKQVDEVLPYVDIIFGNETEAESYAKSHNLESSSPADVAKYLSGSTKLNTQKPRVAVITQGADATLVSVGGQDAKVYPVDKIEASQIVDTNGAGDAFCGGFVGAHVLGKNLDQSVEAGHRLAKKCIQEVGPTFGKRADILQGL